MSSSPAALPALRTQPKAIFFTDFDGTITLQDSNDFLTDNLGFGAELRRKGNRETLEGTRTFRDTFQEMMDSVKTPFDVCVRTLLENVQLDPAFKEFHSVSHFLSTSSPMYSVPVATQVLARGGG